MSPPPRGPLPTVDVIAEMPGGGIVLVRRKHPPPGWALPGGFVEAGESVATAARREFLEETGLAVDLLELFHVYADPARDPRGPTLSTVFIGRATGTPAGADDAAEARVFRLDALPAPLAFDHALILADYHRYRRDGRRPPPDR
ncbi:MAG TPA: NUDIX hydrolase [Methylomirabilota bacterium]